MTDKQETASQELVAKTESAPAEDLEGAAEPQKANESAAVAAIEPGSLDAADMAAYEEFQERLKANQTRREEAERLRAQAAALEAGDKLTETRSSLESTLVDDWTIDSQELPAILTQYHAEKPIARIVLQEDILARLLHDLNLLYLAPEDAPITWAVRYPDYSEIPVLTLFRGEEVLGSLPMDEDFGKPVGAILNNIYPTTPRVPAWGRFKNWVRHHRVISVLLAIVLLPFIAIFLYGVFTNLLAYAR